MNDLALHTLQGIELFSGVGMLGEGLRAGLDYMGFAYRSLCHVEREAYAASVLVARMEEGSMDAAPVWSDVCTFDARAWRGKVDCVVAGFPCQDLSVAGKRAGLDGKRSGLFFEVTRIADDSGAWFILLENVAGIASATATVMDEEEGELDERAAARVLGELADLGWDAEWITLSAFDVGASHGRARWFCIAWKLDNARRMQRRTGYEQDRSGSAEASGYQTHDRAANGSFDVDDAERSEWRSSCSGIAGRQQGNDGRREETHGWTGIADEVLGDSRLQHGKLQQRSVRPEHSGAGNKLANTAMLGRETRPGIYGTETALVGAGCGEFRVVDQCSAMADTKRATVRRDGRAASCAQSEDGRRCANDDHGAECVCRFVDQPESIGWNQGRPESIRQQGRSDATERRMSVANACNPRLQGNEQQSAHEQDGRTDGRTDGAGIMPTNCRISS